MLKILADSSIPHLDYFQPAFELLHYDNHDTLKKQIVNADILICRSTLTVDEELLQHTAIQTIATASSGIDHIDQSYLHTRNINLFDAKGCNAHAVADYVSSCVAWLLKHHYLESANIAHQHANIPFKAQTTLKAGVIGMGCVGTQVSQRLMMLGFEVVHYDPLKAIEDASFESCTLEALKNCQLICVHANLHETKPHASRNLLNYEFLSTLNPQTIIVNASRGGIVNESDLLRLDNSIIYCTDVYEDEPHIKNKIVDYATLCTPHIAGHSIEAKSNAVIHLAKLLHAHYRLNPLTPIHFFNSPFISLLPQETLAEYFLRLYNPLEETKQLKHAKDKPNTFLSLRKAHHFRHDFRNEILE